MASEKKQAEGESNIWSDILASASSQATSRKLPTKTLLVLGDEGSGKTSLIARLRNRKQAQEGEPQGIGLEYTYLELGAKEDDSTEEVVGRMGVYTLAGDPDNAHLLSFVLNKQTLPDCMAMIVVDLTRPWLIPEALERWVHVLEELVQSLDAPAEIEERKAQLVKEYKMFSEAPTKAKEGEEESVLLDLDEGVFSQNIGIPIIVVCTKADRLTAVMENRDYRQEHLDYIQLAIRKFCLRLGAALVFTGKDEKSKGVLQRYLVHKAYGVPLKEAANTLQQELFIPAGWDNPAKANVLAEGFQSIHGDEAWDKVIPTPQPPPSGKVDVQAEDEQEFLKKQQPLLGKTTAKEPERRSTLSGTAATPARAAATAATAAATESATPAAAAAGGAAATPKRPDAAGAQSTDVLANFFNSLLNKKQPAPGAPPASG